MDPITYWTRILSASAGFARNGYMAQETITAAKSVVSARTKMMDDAVRTPLTTDYVELSRMVPEKISAFSEAALALVTECWSMQAALLGEMHHAGSVALRGRLPTPTELSALMVRQATYAVSSVERMSAIGTVTLAPIHKAATGNARRLSRSSRSRRKTS